MTIINLTKKLSTKIKRYHYQIVYDREIELILQE